MRLEVTTDGRHITFLLVSLYEAGYGVQVVGSPAMFRELICLRKSAPIPFVIGGKEYEVGISITDKSGFNHGEHGGGKRVLLDYDYFSGLMERVEPHPGGWAAARETAVRQPEGRDERERTSQITRIEAEQAGQRLAGQAGAEFSNPFTSELAQDSENTSPTRSATVPAGAHIAPGDRISQIGDRVTGSDGGNQSADSMELLEGQSQAGLQMDNQKGPTIRTANDPTAPGEKSESVKFDSLDPSRLALRADLRSLHLTPAPALDCGQNASSPATSHSPLATALRAPYFMHPSVYHRGLHKSRSPSTAFDSAAKQRRRFRIGFFGTHDRDFYTKHYHFPGMNRFEILEAFFEKFGDIFVNLEGAPQDWKAAQIAVSIDSQGGDRKGKTFLSQDHYFEALQECDFVLSPPGICTPLSHSLIEAMFCGAVPITNSGLFMTPPLEDGRNYLEFYNSAGFSNAIEKALAMTDSEILELRLAAFDYYRRFLNPVAFGHSLEVFARGRLLVNAEEKSVPFIYPRFIWPQKS